MQRCYLQPSAIALHHSKLCITPVPEQPRATIPRMRFALKFASLALLFLPSPLLLHARVDHVEVASRVDVQNGKSFGNAGAYERIVGRVYFSVAVQNQHNARIVDLADAVNLKNGEVEFSADFIAVRPKDPSKS